MLEVTVPSNTSAEVTLWETDVDRIREGGRPVSDARGVRAVRRQGGDVIVTVGSGSYEFTVARAP